MKKVSLLPIVSRLFKKYFFLIIIFAFLVLPLVSLSADPRTNLNQAAPHILQNQGDLPKVIGGIIKAVLGMLGVIFLAFIVYAGFLWAIAEGDSSKIQKAKTIIIWSFAGLVICLGAYAITLYVLGAFGIG